MKTLYFVLAMMTTLGSSSQMVDIAFYHHKEVNQGNFEYNTYKPEHNPVTVSKSLVRSESNNMGLPEFRKFGLYEGLLAKLQYEFLVVHSYKLLKETIRFDPEVHQSYNGQIDDKTIELIRNAREGDQYVLYDIIVKNAQGMIFHIPMVIKANIKANSL